MSTRCAICIKIGNIYHSIYCHSDGYPSYVGNILKNHYNKTHKIKELIDLGNISCLGKLIEYKKLNIFDKEYKEKSKLYTFAYHRDCGEDKEYIYQGDNISHLIKKSNDFYCEFLYIFENNKWKSFKLKNNELEEIL